MKTCKKGLHQFEGAFCIECRRISKKISSRNYRKNNTEKAIASEKRCRIAKPEQYKEAGRNRYAANPDKYRIISKAWVKANPEKRKVIAKKWRDNNLEKRNAYEAKYRAQKLNATLSLSKEENTKIGEFYKEASKLSEETGIPHEVDHIIPLQGKNISGLHVPWNLRVITKEENRKKNNKLFV